MTSRLKRIGLSILLVATCVGSAAAAERRWVSVAQGKRHECVVSVVVPRARTVAADAAPTSEPGCFRLTLDAASGCFTGGTFGVWQDPSGKPACTEQSPAKMEATVHQSTFKEKFHEMTCPAEVPARLPIRDARVDVELVSEGPYVAAPLGQTGPDGVLQLCAAALAPVFAKSLESLPQDLRAGATARHIAVHLPHGAHPSNALIQLDSDRFTLPLPKEVTAEIDAETQARLLDLDKPEAVSTYLATYSGTVAGARVAEKFSAKREDRWKACAGAAASEKLGCLKAFRRDFKDAPNANEVAGELASALARNVAATIAQGKLAEGRAALDDLDALGEQGAEQVAGLRVQTDLKRSLGASVKKALSAGEVDDARAGLALFERLADPGLQVEGRQLELMRKQLGQAELAAKRREAAAAKRAAAEQAREEAADRRKHGPLWEVKLVCGGMSVPFETTMRARTKAEAVRKVCSEECEGSLLDYNVCMRKCVVGKHSDSCEWSVYPGE